MPASGREQIDSATTRDVAGVVAPPPVIYGLALTAGGLAHVLFPLSIASGGVPRALGVLMIGIAVPIAALAFRAMMRARTHFDPYKPSTVLLTGSIYSLSRNPMYLALNLLSAGVALVVNSVWMLAALAPALAILRYGVVAREERYLARKFGDRYLDYSATVRRWL